MRLLDVATPATPQTAQEPNNTQAMHVHTQSPPEPHAYAPTPRSPFHPTTHRHNAVLHGIATHGGRPAGSGGGRRYVLSSSSIHPSTHPFPHPSPMKPSLCLCVPYSHIPARPVPRVYVHSPPRHPWPVHGPRQRHLPHPVQERLPLQHRLPDLRVCGRHCPGVGVLQGY